MAYNHVVKVAMQQDLLNCVMFLDKAASDSVPSICIFTYSSTLNIQVIAVTTMYAPPALQLRKILHCTKGRVYGFRNKSDYFFHVIRTTKMHTFYINVLI